MKVKEIMKTVNVAWSPDSQSPIMLAAGTAAQQLDASFSTASALELYSLNLQQPGYNMELLASMPSDQKFHKIIWGSENNQPNTTSGVIVGGCDKGTIKLYSAKKLFANDPSSMICSRDRHKGAVKAMDFNPLKANLFATGAAENEIFIWDVEKMEPMKPGTCAQAPEDVQHIAWNKKFQHILASTFSQCCMVWDLRKNETIMKLPDSNAKARWKVIEWHPDEATQLCRASEEDLAPVIELWDLRCTKSPLSTLQNHQRGVLSIAWCPHDSDLLVSCSKDNRILCWNPNPAPNGELTGELAQTTQWNFDVSWCPKYPGLIAGSSFDGHVVVYSLLGGKQQEILENTSKIADSFPGISQITQPAHPVAQTESTAELTKAPKWLKRPFGASFGFGGKLTIFENSVSDVTNSSTKTVYISSVVTNPDLVQRSNELDSALKSMQYSDYCKKKIDFAADDHEKRIWKCISTYFEADDKKELLMELGYNVDSMNNKLNQYIPNELDDVTQGFSRLRTVQNGNVLDGSEPFDAIAQREQNRSPDLKQSESDFKLNISDDDEGLITQAILVNNIEAAVSLCFSSKRYADAIILSMAGGTDLLARAQYRYFSEHSGALNSLINSVVSENWFDIANNCNIICWKKALVGIFIHCNNEERFALCEILGDRLMASANPELRKQAPICYICSGNLEKVVNSIETDIEKIVELISILQKGLEFKGTRNVKLEGKAATVLATYAEMLASEGSFETALSFLGDSQEPTIVQLRDRLHKNLGIGKVDNQQFTKRPSQNYFDPTRRISQSSNYGVLNPMNQWNTEPTRPMNSYMNTNYNPVQQVQPSYNAPYQPTPMAPVSTYQPPPPPPTSTTPKPQGVVPPTRPKHVIDPSINPSYGTPAPFAQPSPYSMPTYPTPPSNPMYPTGPMNTTFYNPSESDTNQSSALGTPMMPNYAPPRPEPKYQEENIYRADQKPGWNDPPSIKSNRTQEKTEYQPQDPILHPMGNVAQPDYGLPPVENYYPDTQMYNQQYNQMPNQIYNKPMDTMYNQPVQSAQIVKAPEPEKPKAPIPDEHVHLKTVLDELRVQCLENARNPQIKRKVEEVSKKLEVLYDCLRENKLSPNTLQGLHQISHFIQEGDYTSGLGLHTQLVSGSDFSQIASFMPGIKVLLQSALQLGVYIR